MGTKPRTSQVRFATGSQRLLSDEQIEQLRTTGIHLDAGGDFWHQGRLVTHPGLQRAFRRWLDVLPDGRFILRLDDHRFAYIDVADTPLLVTSLRWQGNRAWIQLNDDSDEELSYTTLRQGRAYALYCRVRNNKLDARLTTAAYYQLAQHIVEKDDQFFLDANGQQYIIRDS